MITILTNVKEKVLLVQYLIIIIYIAHSYANFSVHYHLCG